MGLSAHLFFAPSGGEARESAAGIEEAESDSGWQLNQSTLQCVYTNKTGTQNGLNCSFTARRTSMSPGASDSRKPQPVVVIW